MAAMASIRIFRVVYRLGVELERDAEDVEQWRRGREVLIP
jgi:hypothetical protein